MITVEHLIHKYKDHIVLNGVSFSQNKGTVTAIIGPSGSGKTTLLRTLNALAIPKSGTIQIDNQKFIADKHSKKTSHSYERNLRWYFKTIIYLRTKQYLKILQLV